VTQLAQFQTMEQSMSQGQDISAMHTDLDTIVADLTASNATASK
jgi:flagellar hook assembly protein FlgD